MIVVVTGLPGAGKTLYTLQMVREWASREARPVSYSGIKDLKFPWAELADGAHWVSQPAKSIVVIDEAQRVFRPRATGSAVPAHVAALETHRHQGLDLVLVTQHPKLLDVNVRRLVGRHLHVVRTFGMQRATVHEWGELNDACESGSGRQESIRHEWRYPVDLFAAYASAEVHTHKRSIPARVWLLLLVPFVVAALGWVGWQSFSSGAKGGDPFKVSGQQTAAGPVKTGGDRKAPTVAEYVFSRTARLEGLPQTAPAYDGVTAPVRAPYPAMCIAAAGRCRCYTDQGTRLDTPEGLCRTFAERGFFVEWDQKPPERSGGMGAAAPHAEPKRSSREDGPGTGNAGGYIPSGSLPSGLAGPDNAVKK